MFGKHRCGAFSLVELLIVVSILALLIAVLLPGLRQAREQTKITVCASRLREIGLAWRAYKSDHGGEYPAELNVHRKFRVYLDPYAGIPEVFRCPSDRMIWPRSDRPETQNSYQMSPVLMGRRYQPSLPPTHPRNAPRLTWEELDQRVRRCRVIEPTVAESQLAIGGDYDWLLVVNTPPEERTDKYVFHRMRGKNNLLFYDDHVAYVRQYYRYYITPHYTMNPYRDLVPIARDRDLVGP
jgi:competence protein ComGC